MDLQIVNLITNKLHEMYNKTHIRQFDIYNLKNELPELDYDDIIESLYYLRSLGKIIGEEQEYHGGKIIKNFVIPDYFIS